MAARGEVELPVAARKPARIRRTLTIAISAAALVLGVVPAAGAAPPRFFGIVPGGDSLPTAEDLSLMRSAGIGSMRIYAAWPGIEPQPGVFDWSVPDRVIGGAAAYGIEPLVFLNGSPTWAAHADRYPCSGPECDVYPPRSSATRAAFAEFARQAVRRYGPNGSFWRPTPPACLSCPPGPPPCLCASPRPVTKWQIWNEQNSTKYFAPKVNPRRYAKLVVDTAGAIQAEDPSAEIILGGMWGPEISPRAEERPPTKPVSRFMRGFYREPGVETAFDSIAIHPYSANVEGVVRQLEAARRALRDAGDRGKRIWVTELGWASTGPRRNPYVKGFEGQARMLRRSFRELARERRSLRLRGVLWYAWRDSAGGAEICEWCANAGLVRVDGTRKPAYAAFARVAGPRLTKGR